MIIPNPHPEPQPSYFGETTAGDVTRLELLERQILKIADQEKEQLGRELHDGLCQSLAGIAALSAALARSLAASAQPTASAAAAEIAELLNGAIGQAHDLAHGLGPIGLNGAGIAGALETLALNIRHMFHATCVAECDRYCPRLPDETASHLFRIAQEAVRNAINHGRADRIEISLTCHDGKGLLSVRDDGVGMPENARNGDGIGLHTMDYRSRAIGGSLVVTRHSRRGTVVACAFPRRRRKTSAKVRTMPATMAEPPAPFRKTIFIVDDHPVLRRGLTALIETEPDLLVCGAVATLRAALETVREREPDLVVVDLVLADGDGLDLVKQMKTCHPAIVSLVLSMYDESVYAERALRAGARGYITKQQLDETVLVAIRRVLAGGTYMSDALERRLAEQYLGGRTLETGSPLHMLSDRELQVFRQVGEGKTTREIAATISRSIKTVESHLEHIKNKLAIGSAAALARYATRLIETAGCQRSR